MAYQKRATEAFALVELAAVLAVVGLLLVAAVFALKQVKKRAAPIKCVNQLKNVGLAYRIFATDSGDRFPFQLSATNGGTKEFEHDIVRQYLALTNELYTPRLLVCVTRAFGRARNSRGYETEAKSWAELSAGNIDYFVNLDADEAAPRRILAADDELQIGGKTAHGLQLVRTNDVLSYPAGLHENGGNYGNAVMSDGSVEQFGSERWAGILADSGLETNRFLLP